MIERVKDILGINRYTARMVFRPDVSIEITDLRFSQAQREADLMQLAANWAGCCRLAEVVPYVRTSEAPHDE